MIDRFLKASSLMALPVAALLLASGPAAADGPLVTLKLSATPVALTGRLISDDGARYVLKTRFGTVEVAKSAAECRGCSADMVVARAE